MTRTLILAGLLVASGAQAQERSDLMNQAIPTEPPPPAGSSGTPAGMGGYVYPGAPLPPNPSVERAPQAGSSEGAKRPGLFVPEGGAPDLLNEGQQHAEDAPETHTVRKGDTLWDLSAHYLNSPWSWPKLWSYNPSITNPHWIYPGDLIRLYAPGTAPPVAALPNSPGPRLIGRPRGAKGVFLRQFGFVEEADLKIAGKIIGSPEEKKMLATLDDAYVKFPADKPMQVGERYTVYMPIGEIVHPVTNKKLGKKVQIFGEVDVRAVTDGHIARVEIVDATDPIERNFFVGPLHREFKIVEPKVDRSNVRGVVVAVLQPREMVSYDNIVFIDQGRQDGLEVGNRLLLVRRGDGYAPLLHHIPVDDPQYPPETLSEILIVETRDHISTGLVTKSNVEARVGNRVEARLGY